MDKLEIGIMQGKLSIINRILNTSDCCDDEDLLYGSCCNICILKANLTKERFNLNSLINGEKN